MEKEFIKQIGEQSKFKGDLFEIVERKMSYRKAGKTGSFEFEVVRRPPGVRCLVIRDNKILLTKEYRAELAGFDYRVPGGKVFDTLNEFLSCVDNDNEMQVNIEKAVIREAHEEIGIVIKEMKLFAHAKLIINS